MTGVMVNRLGPLYPRSLRVAWATLPTVEAVSARPFTSAERHTGEPKNQQNCGHNPKEMGGEANSRKKQHEQKYQQDNHDFIFS